jgi:hypothetical protein
MNLKTVYRVVSFVMCHCWRIDDVFLGERAAMHTAGLSITLVPIYQSTRFPIPEVSFLAIVMHSVLQNVLNGCSMAVANSRLPFTTDSTGQWAWGL